jgi:hypothetical protein
MTDELQLRRITYSITAELRANGGHSEEAPEQLIAQAMESIDGFDVLYVEVKPQPPMECENCPSPAVALAPDCDAGCGYHSQVPICEDCCKGAFGRGLGVCGRCKMEDLP